MSETFSVPKTIQNVNMSSYRRILGEVFLNDMLSFFKRIQSLHKIKLNKATVLDASTDADLLSMLTKAIENSAVCVLDLLFRSI